MMGTKNDRLFGGKKRSVGCVALLAAQISAKKQEGPLGGKAAAVAATDDQAIGRIAEDWRNAYNGREASKVAAPYSEDGYYLSAHILAHGREAIEAYWRHGIMAGGRIRLVFRKMAGGSACPTGGRRNVRGGLD